MDGFGVDWQFVEHGIGGKKFDIVVAAHLFSKLLKDGFAEGVDGLGYVNFDDDLLAMIDEQWFHYNEDALRQILLGGVNHGYGAF